MIIGKPKTKRYEIIEVKLKDKKNRVDHQTGKERIWKDYSKSFMKEAFRSKYMGTMHLVVLFDGNISNKLYKPKDSPVFL